LRSRQFVPVAGLPFEKHAAKVDGDSMADNFPAYGVHVYKLE
jgi:hypothetical protein